MKLSTSDLSAKWSFLSFPPSVWMWNPWLGGAFVLNKSRNYTNFDSRYLVSYHINRFEGDKWFCNLICPVCFSIWPWSFPHPNHVTILELPWTQVFLSLSHGFSTHSLLLPLTYVVEHFWKCWPWTFCRYIKFQYEDPVWCLKKNHGGVTILPKSIFLKKLFS